MNELQPLHVHNLIMLKNEIFFTLSGRTKLTSKRTCFLSYLTSSYSPLSVTVATAPAWSWHYSKCFGDLLLSQGLTGSRAGLEIQVSSPHKWGLEPLQYKASFLTCFYLSGLMSSYFPPCSGAPLFFPRDKELTKLNHKLKKREILNANTVQSPSKSCSALSNSRPNNFQQVSSKYTFQEGRNCRGGIT